VFVSTIPRGTGQDGLSAPGTSASAAGTGATGISLDRPGRHRAGATAVADASAAAAAGPLTAAVLDYSMTRSGRSLALLQAGCTTAGTDPDISRLRAAGCEVTVSLIDDDNAAARTAVAAEPGLAGCMLADLRVVPLAPRSFDIVQCTVLERIAHAELVLDRLVETLRPGGLLLLRVRDRDSAAGFLDRKLPRPLRSLVWHGQAGPGRLYPAVYEQISSARGIQSYAQRCGRMISQRPALSGMADGRAGPAWARLALRLTQQLSMGRHSCAHDDLCFVIRKPEPAFARVL
jgi:SAM-dependent methyltransferase